MPTPQRRFACVPPGEPRLLEGARLFNAGAYFEAHDAWESLWHEVDGEERALLQGLIQFAVAFYHVMRGNRTGAEELYLKGRTRVARWAPEHAGLALGTLLEAVDAYFSAIRRGVSPGPQPTVTFIA